MGLTFVTSKLYRPRHGRAALAITWLLAIVGFTRAVLVHDSPEWLQFILLLGLPGIALLATLVTRDLYRTARGEPPVNHQAPGSVSGFTRAALLVLGAAGLWVTVMMLWAGVSWPEMFSTGGLSLCFLIIGIRRRVSPGVAEALGESPDPSVLD
jgi:predicted membrane channel-forming protein YqfA (hemolysin III family)